MLQFFEWYLPADASLWRRLYDKAERLAARGITAIWLPPAYKGYGGAKDVGYGVYDLYDLGEFDQKGSTATKYGTRSEYLACIRELQRVGIDVYADIAINHLMGADAAEEVRAVETAQENRLVTVGEPEKIEAWTRFTFPGRKGKYSNFQWGADCFSGVDYDARKEKSGIYHFDGVNWSPKVDKEKANFDFLMGADVNFKNKKVRAELLKWGRWYLRTTGVDGFRLDALKHIDSAFFEDWLRVLRAESRKELFTVGEYWHADRNVLEQYLDACGRCMSLFDVPLHFNFFAASHSMGGFDMRKIFDGSIVQCDPEKSVTFVNNHDTQAGQALESVVQAWFVPLAYALILLRTEGYPCLFYGDYYGVKKFSKKGFTGVIDVLMFLRRKCLFGMRHDYFDHEDIVGWSYEGDEMHENSGLAVVMTDRFGGTKRMLVGKSHIGEIWADVLEDVQEPVVIDKDGYGEFGCRDGAVSVWAKRLDGKEGFVLERLDEEAI